VAAKILVIEDSKSVRREIVKILHALKKKAFEAHHGRAGLDLLAKIGDCQLILCDVTMPEMNGLEFLEALRADERYAKIPVIMLTSDANEDSKKAFAHLNVTAWLHKPFSMPAVKVLLEKHGA
jgi:CheY-like chemotaxis protein